LKIYALGVKIYFRDRLVSYWRYRQSNSVIFR
jgi:hypothetical protein